jgi:hypothetical protein
MGSQAPPCKHVSFAATPAASLSSSRRHRVAAWCANCGRRQKHNTCGRPQLSREDGARSADSAAVVTAAAACDELSPQGHVRSVIAVVQGELLELDAEYNQLYCQVCHLFVAATTLLALLASSVRERLLTSSPALVADCGAPNVQMQRQRADGVHASTIARVLQRLEGEMAGKGDRLRRLHALLQCFGAPP